MPLTLLARQFMMRRPSHRIDLPIPGAARFGRSRTRVAETTSVPCLATAVTTAPNPQPP